jgi:hypothetical protein
MRTGVTRPMKTTEEVSDGRVHWNDRLQLLIQFDAVASDTPRARDDTGKTSPGRIHPIGPKLVPYAAVKMYTNLLYNVSCDDPG